MDDKELLNIYTDYLISSFGATTGTGLSRLLDGAEFWKIVKPYVRQIQAEDGVMIVDDSISEKPHTDENEMVSQRSDHQRDQLHHLALPCQSNFSSVQLSSGCQNRGLYGSENKPKETSSASDKKTNLPAIASASEPKQNNIPLCGQQCLVRLGRQYDVRQTRLKARFCHALEDQS